MKPLRAPWQVWAAIGLTPILWFLYQGAGDPEIHDPRRALGILTLWAILLLWGSRISWAVGTAYTGALGIILIYQAFDPSSEPSSDLVHAALIVVTLGQFALLVRPATMDWVNVKDRRAVAPPAAPT